MIFTGKGRYTNNLRFSQGKAGTQIFYDYCKIWVYPVKIEKYGCTGKGRYTNNLQFSQGKAKAGTQIIYDFHRQRQVHK